MARLLVYGIVGLCIQNSHLLLDLLVEALLFTLIEELNTIFIILNCTKCTEYLRFIQRILKTTASDIHISFKMNILIDKLPLWPMAARPLSACVCTWPVPNCWPLTIEQEHPLLASTRQVFFQIHWGESNKQSVARNPYIYLSIF